MTDVSVYNLRSALLPSVINNVVTLNNNVAKGIGLSGPATPLADWYLMYKRWEVIIHLNGGTLVMREAGTKYLPKEEGETDTIYRNRLDRSVLYGAYSRTVKSLSSLPFITPIQFQDLPETLDYLRTAADGTDQDIESLCQELTQDIIDYGKCHILVEYPVVQDGLRAGEERDNNIRPYFVRISPLNLIRWKTRRVGSVEVLSEVSIYEDVVETDPNDEFSENVFKQVRIISENSVRIIRITESNKRGKTISDFTTVAEYPLTLGVIPLVTIYGANKIGFMQSAPLLEELAWLNVRHWGKQSDLDNIEHVANVPFALATGVGDEEMASVVLGSHMMLKMTSENADIKYVEHSGAAIGTTQNSIKMLEDRMVAMGADLLSAKTSTRETAYSSDINNTKSISILESLVRKLETGMKQAFAFAGMWMGVEANVTVDIGESLNLSLDANEMTSLVSMLKDEILTPEGLSKELKRRGILADSTEVNKPKKEEPKVLPGQPKPATPKPAGS
jgi:hypothetical protein